jgi:hypothetical protein
MADVAVAAGIHGLDGNDDEESRPSSPSCPPTPRTTLSTSVSSDSLASLRRCSASPSPGPSPLSPARVGRVVAQYDHRTVDGCRERDKTRLASRREDIRLAKSHPNYLAPSDRPRDLAYPSTPDATRLMSRRNWVGQLRAWKLAVHRAHNAIQLRKGVQAEDGRPRDLQRTVASVQSLLTAPRGHRARR